MFKYDDVISTLTLVNTLARDPNYGNCKQEKYITCKLDEAQNQDFAREQSWELYAFENTNLAVLKVRKFCKNIFYLEKLLRSNLLIRNLQKYFCVGVNVCENLIIVLQKMVFYNLQLKCGYG